MSFVEQTKKMNRMHREEVMRLSKEGFSREEILKEMKRIYSVYMSPSFVESVKSITFFR